MPHWGELTCNLTDDGQIVRRALFSWVVELCRRMFGGAVRSGLALVESRQHNTVLGGCSPDVVVDRFVQIIVSFYIVAVKRAAKDVERTGLVRRCADSRPVIVMNWHSAPDMAADLFLAYERQEYGE